MKQIFINLSVQNLVKSVHFYSQLGFDSYPLFTFEDQKCMAWGSQILIMLQQKESAVLENIKMAHGTKGATASFTLPLDSLEKVHGLAECALKAGGKEPMTFVDEGFMQLRTIEDLDGYQWGLIYLDIEKFKALKGKH